MAWDAGEDAEAELHAGIGVAQSRMRRVDRRDLRVDLPKPLGGLALEQPGADEFFPIERCGAVFARAPGSVQFFHYVEGLAAGGPCAPCFQSQECHLAQDKGAEATLYEAHVAPIRAISCVICQYPVRWRETGCFNAALAAIKYCSPLHMRRLSSRHAISEA